MAGTMGQGLILSVLTTVVPSPGNIMWLKLYALIMTE